MYTEFDSLHGELDNKAQALYLFNEYVGFCEKPVTQLFQQYALFVVRRMLDSTCSGL